MAPTGFIADFFLRSDFGFLLNFLYFTLDERDSLEPMANFSAFSLGERGSLGPKYFSG